MRICDPVFLPGVKGPANTAVMPIDDRNPSWGMTMNYRIRKPDPLLLLALAVGLGVVVTTAAQADPPEFTQGDTLQEARAQLALRPMKGLAERLEMHWLNSALDRPAVNRLLSRQPLGMGKPFGRQGPELNMSWRPRIAVTAHEAGDAGIGAADPDRPDIFINLHRSW